MNRRNFFNSFLAIPVAALITREIKTKIGYVSAHFPSQRMSRVWLDGVEVTHNCFEADDIRGYVGLFKRDGYGHVYWDFFKDDVARERRYGNVQIKLGRS